ncbi:hypothetical protein HWV62_19479 [Athelia sp. TMB]|nr:hypothetical protein HWV62_19479 [Athelia sp. TMB]
MKSKSRARAVIGTISTLIGTLKCSQTKSTYPPPPQNACANASVPVNANDADDDDLPDYATAQHPMQMTQTTQFTAPASHSAAPPTRRVAGARSTRTTPRPGSALSHTSTASHATTRRIAGGPGTRIGARSPAAQSTRRPGTALSHASLTSARSLTPSHAHLHLSPADRAFIEALSAVELPPAEIARIATLLALAPPPHAHRALPAALLATVPDFAPGEAAFLGRLWACDVGLAEISRVVEVVRERRGERGAGFWRGRGCALERHRTRSLRITGPPIAATAAAVRRRPGRVIFDQPSRFVSRSRHTTRSSANTSPCSLRDPFAIVNRLPLDDARELAQDMMLKMLEGTITEPLVCSAILMNNYS